MFKKLGRKFSNATLRLKIVIMMSLMVTVTPTILVSVLAFTYYHIGVESLFNEKISKVVTESVDIAEAYLKEHKENIKTDILAISKDIERNYFTLKEDPSLFTPFLDKQAELRNLSEIMVFQRDKVIAKNSFTLSLAFEKFPEEQLNSITDLEPVIINTKSDDKVRAIIKLNEFTQTYLLVGMFVDREIINHLKNSQGSASTYQLLLRDINKSRLKLEIAFFVVSGLLCTIAILIGMSLAKNITKPINRLVKATENVSKGDFSITLRERPGKDEISILTRAFNNMTSTLEVQRKQLVQFNNLIDERRRFIEAVLAEVTAGVIVISVEEEITLFNTSAGNLLKLNNIKGGTKVETVFSEIKEMISEVQQDPSNIVQQHCEIIRGNKKMHLFIRIGAQLNSSSEIESYIVTFDDISDLVSAQRLAAWGDVARRIAHEIKNPLTPIQLSAERLKSKFATQFTDKEKEKFEKYVDTIVRHVEGIGKIVEEFVQFSRIPAPKLSKTNLMKLVKDSVFLFKNAYKNIKFKINSEQKSITAICDHTQITQVLTNLIKNSCESIISKGNKGYINIDITQDDNKNIFLKITDNGLGFGKDVLDRAIEPYVTTKSEGTGLGLAIVKKIVEDHGGKLMIANAEEGAEITFSLKLFGDTNE